jgi:hypothetical protein
MPRRIFGLKRGEMVGAWRKLHNEEFHNVYYSPSINRIIKSRRIRWAGHVALTEEKKNAYRILVGKPEGKTLDCWVFFYRSSYGILKKHTKEHNFSETGSVSEKVSFVFFLITHDGPSPKTQ